MRRRFAVVFNARAGSAVPRLLDGVLAELRAVHRCDVFQLPARSAEEAAERVSEAAARGVCDAVIAAGGDGTFRGVAIGAAGTSLPVGLIPLGTGNVLAHELGLVRRRVALADTLLNGPVIATKASLVNGAPFFLMVGAGFDGRVVAALNYRSKRIFGRAAYSVPVLRALGHGAEAFDVVLDGERFEASWIIVTRASHYGGQFVLTRDTGVGRAPLIAIIIAARTRLELIAAALALPLGRMIDASKRPPFVTIREARHVEIGNRSTVAVEVDGDAATPAPVIIDADGPTVRLIVPKSYADALSVAVR
ncbi:MAG: diacylglycerol kinase [Hyphomicrobium sp.]|nr:diacylglycerol kinase [Hyphomicrobium sp.]